MLIKEKNTLVTRHTHRTHSVYINCLPFPKRNFMCHHCKDNKEFEILRLSQKGRELKIMRGYFVYKLWGIYCFRLGSLRFYFSFSSRIKYTNIHANKWDLKNFNCPVQLQKSLIYEIISLYHEFHHLWVRNIYVHEYNIVHKHFIRFKVNES